MEETVAAGIGRCNQMQYNVRRPGLPLSYGPRVPYVHGEFAGGSWNMRQVRLNWVVYYFSLIYTFRIKTYVCALKYHCSSSTKHAAFRRLLAPARLLEEFSGSTSNMGQPGLDWLIYYFTKTH